MKNTIIFNMVRCMLEEDPQVQFQKAYKRYMMPYKELILIILTWFFYIGDDPIKKLSHEIT